MIKFPIDTLEHVQNGGLTSTIDYWKGAIAFDFAIMSAFSKEIGVMVLVRETLSDADFQFDTNENSLSALLYCVRSSDIH